MDGESKPVDYAVDQAVVHESLLVGTFSRNRSLSTILAFTLFSLFIFIEQKNAFVLILNLIRYLELSQKNSQKGPQTVQLGQNLAFFLVFE